MADLKEREPDFAYFGGQSAAIIAILVTVMRNVYTPEECEDILNIFESTEVGRDELSQVAQDWTNKDIFRQGWSDFIDDFAKSIRSGYEE